MHGSLANEPDSSVARGHRGASKRSPFPSLRTLFTKRHEAAGVFYGTKFVQFKLPQYQILNTLGLPHGSLAQKVSVTLREVKSNRRYGE